MLSRWVHLAGSIPSEPNFLLNDSLLADVYYYIAEGSPITGLFHSRSALFHRLLQFKQLHHALDGRHTVHVQLGKLFP